MITPATRNITIYTRATFEDSYELRYEDGEPVDLSECQIESELWDIDRTIMHARFTIIPTDLTNGKFSRQLTDTLTAALDNVDGDIYCDLALTLPNSKRYYLERGRVSLKRGYT